MNATLVYTTFLFQCLIVLVLVGRGLSQVKKINLKNIYFIMVFIGLTTFVVMEASLLVPIKFQFQMGIMKSSLGLLFFSLLGISGICIVDLITDKKLKTLLRLPLIGTLLGQALKVEHLAIILVVAELFQLYLFNKYKNRFRYCFRQQIKAVLGLLVATLIYYNQVWLFHIGFTFFIVMKFQILNAAKLKLLVSEKAKANNEDKEE